MGEGVSIFTQEQLREYPLFKEIYRGSMWIEEKLSVLKDSSSDIYDHSLRVAFLASEISLFVGLPEVDRLNLTKAALLHDLGKKHVSKELLEAGILSDEEKQQIDIHVRTGYEEISDYDPLVANLMVGHHEFQPRSYPRKSERLGENPIIKKLQSLLALCDGVDALLSNRSYREASLPENVYENLSSQFEDSLLINFAIQTRLRIRL